MDQILPTAYFQKLVARGAFSQALAELSRVVLDEPKRADAWCYLGICYTETGHQKEAIGALTTAWALGSSSYEVPEALGCAYLRRRDLDAAEEWFLRALQEIARDQKPLTRQGPDPGRLSSDEARAGRGSILRNLAMTRIYRGDLEDAQFLLEEALEATPEDVLSLHALSALQMQLKNTEGARKNLETILAAPAAPRWLQTVAERNYATLLVGWPATS
ncbi:Tetratricopeptide repeat-containing protein [Alkalispirochaeta americana]|uniref:Tetratricopeptide repeat-containing protein n=1 Tax=Alkalispirochaeta americana TaxID=159291 RepID=A0A1N6RIL1_9SPIO|nr:tetratricopeptide repeat protein [Alkalispirochaeta americana]SIQ28627.1 Tetratricopeptide repeat-containing protein [Alkalispirochaeta americana]